MSVAEDGTVEIVVVCMGNIARSPFAEALLQREASRRLGPDAPVWVHSVGVRGLTGHGAVEEMRSEAHTRGLDLSAHRGAAMDASALRGPDLVLTMTGSHRDSVIRLVPSAEPRTFTVKEFARLAEHVTAPQDVPVVARVRTVVQAAHEQRPRVPGPSGPEDVHDPYGSSTEVYRHIAEEIEDLVETIAPVLFGPRGSGNGPRL